MIKRNEGLDFLRGIAILLVLFRHLPVSLKFLPNFLFVVFIRIKSFGYIGVDLFFVLSGFLVSGLYFLKINNDRPPEIKKFLTRRAFKIWPSYYLYVFIMMFFGFYTKSFERNWASFSSALFHIQNYYLTDKLHLWSLAIEEHFYTLLSFIVFLMAKKNLKNFKKNIIVVISLCSLLPFLMRLIFTNHHSYMSHMRADGLFVGVLISAIFHFYHEYFVSLRKYQLPMLCLSFILFIPTFYYIDLANSGYWVRSFGFLMLHIGFGLLLICVLNSSDYVFRKCFNSLPGKFIQQLGILSYGIYLWHFDYNGAFHGLISKFNLSERNFFVGISLFSVYLFSIYLLGLISMNLIEKPFLKLRDRYFK